MCEHHYHYLGTELHRLSPERDREDGGVRTEEREDGQSLQSQLEIEFEAALAFKAGAEENARMKEAEASLD